MPEQQYPQQETTIWKGKEINIDFGIKRLVVVVSQQVV